MMIINQEKETPREEEIHNSNMQSGIMKSLLRENVYYYTAVLILTLLGATVLLTNHKADVTIWVNSHYSPFMDQLFKITDYGGTIGFSGAIIILLIITQGPRVGLKALVCFASAALIVQFLKYVVFPGELRPVLYFEGSHELRLIEGVTQLQTESFPSGHTTAAFSVATFLALLLPGKKWHWLFAIAAASVGYTRLYLSQHFITDVFTGMLIGVTTTTLIYYFYPDQGDIKWRKN